MHTLTPGGESRVMWDPGCAMYWSSGLPTKTPEVAFHAYGGAGGGPELADALHRHPRLFVPSTLRTWRSWV